MELDTATKNIIKIIVMINNKDFENKIFENYDTEKIPNTLTKKQLREICLKLKIISYRKFDISLGILSGLKMINIYKIGSSLGIELTTFGEEYAIKNLGGINNE